MQRIRKESAWLYGSIEPQQESSLRVYGSIKPQKESSLRLYGSIEPHKESPLRLYGSIEPQKESSLRLYGSGCNLLLGGTRAYNPRLRGPTPYPLGHRTSCHKGAGSSKSTRKPRRTRPGHSLLWSRRAVKRILSVATSSREKDSLCGSMEP